MESSQVILVTGSSSGFGRLTVETLARQGHIVFAGIRSVSGKNAPVVAELQALAAQENLKLRVVELDVTDDRSVTQAVQTVIDTAGQIDVVVNNAGVFFSGPLEAFTAEEAQAQFNVNVYGTLRLNKAVIPLMRARGSGLLVQIGSVVGRFAVPFAGLYSASKFALEGLTEAYRYELAPLGIDVSIIEPGAYQTSLSVNGTLAADQTRFQPYQSGLITLGQSFNALLAGTDAQEVANAVAHLITQAPGARPFRVVVASSTEQSPVEKLNKAYDNALPGWAEALNLGQLYNV